MRNNIEATRLVLKLGVAGRGAQTAEEMEILRKYAGFGGLKCILNDAIELADAAKWSKDRMDVVDDCYKEMKRLKSLTAYYTNKNISVSYLRAKKKADTQRVINLYGDGSEKYW